MSYGIIYQAYNKINHKSYIGQTIRPLEIRIRLHYNSEHCPLFHRALEKYEKEDWEWKIIDTADTKEELDEKEIYWIAFYDTHNIEKGYNLTDGGGGSNGFIQSEEAKKKIRESMCNKLKNNHHRPETSNIKPVKCVETGEIFYSAVEAHKATGANPHSIRGVIKGRKHTAGGYHWEEVTGEERVKCLPNAIYCVELNKIYDNAKQARLEDRFHHSNLCKAMKQGKAEEPKHYAGYTFYWVNPQYH